VKTNQSGLNSCTRPTVVTLSSHLQNARMHSDRHFMFHVFDISQRQGKKEFDYVCSILDISISDLKKKVHSMAAKDYHANIRLLLEKTYRLGSNISGSPASLRDKRRAM